MVVGGWWLTYACTYGPWKVQDILVDAARRIALCCLLLALQEVLQSRARVRRMDDHETNSIRCKSTRNGVHSRVEPVQIDAVLVRHCHLQQKQVLISADLHVQETSAWR